jgi:uncharacterized membrane protein YqhA
MAAESPQPEEPPRVALLAGLIGRSRMIVMVAVIAVMVAAISLFLLGAVLSAETVWNAWVEAARGDLGSTRLTVRFLEIVTVMLKEVFFYLIGVGLYSLFIAPLNLTVALGVETLGDLEAKIISVVIVILAVTFLERYIAHDGDLSLFWSAAAMAIAVAALVLFQWQVHRTSVQHKGHGPEAVDHAKVDLFEHSHEEQDLSAIEESSGSPPDATGERPRDRGGSGRPQKGKA